MRSGNPYQDRLLLEIQELIHASVADVSPGEVVSLLAFVTGCLGFDANMSRDEVIGLTASAFDTCMEQMINDHFDKPEG